MRLIGIGLLAFVLAGVSFFLSNSKGLQDVFLKVTEIAVGPNLQFEVRAPKNTGGNNQVIVTRANIDEPIILSGLPAYKGATFFMPVDAHPTSGYLQIDATVQALVGVEGILRVSIDNQRRGEVLLHPGEAGRSLRIQLTEQEIAREQLVVSFSLQGEGPHTPCSTDDGKEAIVEIETTSAIFLATAAPVQSARDKVLVAGRHAELLWPTDPPVGVLLDALEISDSGISVSFSEDGLGTRDVAQAISRKSLAVQRPDYAWSDQLSQSSAIFGLRRFHKTMSWRITYDLHNARRRHPAKSLNLEMEFSELSGGSTWVLSVTHNGSIVDQTRFSGGRISKALDLDGFSIQRKNIIEIQAATNDPIARECARHPAVFAELSVSTELVPDVHEFRDNFLELKETLSKGWSLDAANLTATEANLALDLLRLFPPASKKNERAPASVRFLGRGHDLDLLVEEQGSKWLVFFDTNLAETAVALSDYEFTETQHVSALIEFSEDAS